MRYPPARPGVKRQRFPDPKGAPGFSPQGHEVYLPRFGTRFAAYSIDLTIVGCFTSLISILFFDGSFLQILFSSPSQPMELFYITLVDALYHILLIGAFGRTIGKRWMHIKVISMDGRPVDYLQSVVRYGPYILMGMIGIILLKAYPPEPLSFDLLQREVGSTLGQSGRIIDSVNDPAIWDLQALQNADHPATHFLLEQAKDNAISTMSLVWLAASVLVLFVSRFHRTIHDFMANTVVVYTGRTD